MIDPSQIRKQVAELLQEQEQTLSRLSELLSAETGSLKERDPAKMEQLAQGKLALSQQIEQFSQRLLELMKTQGLDLSAENLTAFMAGLDLADAWQHSVTLLAECQQHNAINGGIIEATRANTDKIIDILHGQTGQPRLYGSSGKYAPSAGISPIAKA